MITISEKYAEAIEFYNEAIRRNPSDHVPYRLESEYQNNFN